MIDTPDTSPEIEYGDRVKLNRPDSEFNGKSGIYSGLTEQGSYLIEVGLTHLIAVPPEQVELVAKREEQ